MAAKLESGGRAASLLLLGGALAAGVASLASVQPEAVASATRVPSRESRTDADQAPAAARIPGLPISFQENRGQFDGRARFAASVPGSATVYVTEHDIVLAAGDGNGTASACLTLIGDDEESTFRGSERLSGTANHLRGADRTDWVTGVPTWKSLRRDEVYPGVDMVLTSREGRAEYRFEVEAGADVSNIVIGMPHAESSVLDREGGLVTRVGGGMLVQSRPVAWQMIDGQRSPVDVSFLVSGVDRAGFILGAHDAARPVVIDPVIGFSTFLGGSDIEELYDVAIDSAGRIVVCGFTESLNFPTTAGVFSPSLVLLREAIVARYTADRTAIDVATYITGDSSEYAQALGILSGDRPVFVGRSASTDYPTASAIQGANNGGDDVVITALTEDMTALVYSTYYGGTQNDQAFDLVVDSDDSVVLCGSTDSDSLEVTPFPTNDASTSSAVPSCFYVRVDGTGALTTATVRNPAFGTSQYRGIALDAATDDVYLCGIVTGSSFVGPTGFEPFYQGGTTDGLVSRLALDGTVLVDTFLGGVNDDAAYGIGLDALGQVFVTGSTRSTDFPVLNSLFPFRSGDEIFLTVFDADLSTLSFSTLISGSGAETANRVEVTPGGTAYITGGTSTAESDFFPLPIQGVQADGTLGGALDAFLLKVSVPSRTLRYMTYFGGSGVDTGTGLVVDPATGEATLVGTTFSADFPTTSPVDSVLDGGRDGFIARFATNTMTFTTAKGKAVEFKDKPDGPGANKDSFLISGKFTINDLGQDLGFDPSTQGLDAVAGPTDQLQGVGVPAGDAGWTTVGDKHTWKKSFGKVKWIIQINMAKSTYKVQVKNINLDAGSAGTGLDMSEQVTVSLLLGENEGARVDIWGTAVVFSSRADETLVSP